MVVDTSSHNVYIAIKKGNYIQSYPKAIEAGLGRFLDKMIKQDALAWVLVAVVYSLSVAGIQEMSIRYEGVFPEWAWVLVVSVHMALVVCTMEKVAEWLERSLKILFSATINDECKKQDRDNANCGTKVPRHLPARHQQD